MLVLTFKLKDNQVIGSRTSKLLMVFPRTATQYCQNPHTQMNNLAVDVYITHFPPVDEKRKDQIVKRELREWYQQNVVSATEPTI